MQDKRITIMSDDDTAKIIDNSNDHKYFVLVPRMVLALVDDAYELALWTVIKDIAGDEGTCIVGVRDLATLGMMSTGKAHQLIHTLMSKQLLFGNLVKDPGKHSQVWHITVPDIWRRNTDWSIHHRSLKGRIKDKAEQTWRSWGERSTERSPGEVERSPGEVERSPGDTKEELKEELKENSEGISQNIWVSLLAELKERMRKHELGTYREYFEPTWLLAIDDHTFTVAVLDERRRAWLADRGTDIIERALAGFTGEKTSVEFVVREETV
jgi:hypothetical protein